MITSRAIANIPAICGIPVIVDRNTDIPARAIGIWPFKRIAVGGAWFLFTNEERHAFLLHEVGHCKLFHFERRVLSLWALIPKKTRPIAIRWAQKHELDADAYAVRHGYGQAILSGLAKIRGTPGMFYPAAGVREAAIRSAMKGIAHESK